MPIFGSDGALVGIVDRVSGVRIVVQRTGASEADQHFIPLSWVASVTDRVTLDCPAADARAPSATRIESRDRRAIGPIVWAGVGVAAVVMIYGAVHLIPRMRSDAASMPRPTPPPAVRPSGEAITAAPSSAPKARATPAVPLAQPAAVAEFLNSNDPVPYRFSLDSVSFAPGSAALDATAARTLTGIAGVMTTHLNTQIKLAIAPGGGALATRRAAAIRAALMARGVAAYRIAVGPSRGRARAGKSGVDLVVLAK